MIEVKIREITENILVPASMGIQINQPNKYFQLYFSESGEVVPDNIYTLKQGKHERGCSVTRGRVRGADWIDSNQPIFII